MGRRIKFGKIEWSSRVSLCIVFGCNFALSDGSMRKVVGFEFEF
jgi:hypothetical protein